MIIGILADQHDRYCDFVQRYDDILRFNCMQTIKLNPSQIDLFECISKLDIFIFRWLHFHDDHQLAKVILPIVQNELKIKCFPDMSTCWHYDDKIKQYYLLKINKMPIIDSWIFWNRRKALEWIETSDYPLVFKLAGGAASSNVVLVKDALIAKKLVNKMFSSGIKMNKIPLRTSTRWKDFSLYKTLRKIGGDVLRKMRKEDCSPYWQIHKNYVMFQKYLPGNDFDTRVTVIGNRAFAFRRLNRTNDFRSSGSGRISYDTNRIDKQFIIKAFEISSKLNFQCMAYDFLYDINGEVKLCEMSYDFVDTAIYRCPGYWDSNVNWHQGNYWPQYFQLMDLLSIPSLCQPELRCHK